MHKLITISTLGLTLSLAGSAFAAGPLSGLLGGGEGGGSSSPSSTSGSQTVPELSAGGMASAFALLFGAGAVLAERRRAKGR